MLLYQFNYKGHYFLYAQITRLYLRRIFWQYFTMLRNKLSKFKYSNLKSIIQFNAVDDGMSNNSETFSINSFSKLNIALFCILKLVMHYGKHFCHRLKWSFDALLYMSFESCTPNFRLIDVGFAYRLLD